MNFFTLIPLIRDIEYESSDVLKHLYITVSGPETYEVRDSKPVAPVTDFMFFLTEPYWDVDGVKHQHCVTSLSVDSEQPKPREYKLEIYYKSKDFKNLLYSGTIRSTDSKINSTTYTPDTDTIIYDPKL